MTGRNIRPTVNFAVGVGEINEIRSRDPQRSVSFWPHLAEVPCSAKTAS